VVLVGNPNVGKSVLFGNLTSRYVTVSNYPGTTVEVARARAVLAGTDCDVIDTPGLNDLTPRSDDGRVTRDLLERHADATIVQVADAKNLRRALLLTLQLADLGRPMVLVLNMLDELEERGGQIDRTRLSELFGIPVVGTIANRGIGMADVVAAVGGARIPQRSAIAHDVDEDEYDRNRSRFAYVNGLLAETYSIEQPARSSWRVRLGFWAMHPIRGLGLLAIVLLGSFWFVGLFGAGTLVDALEVGVFQQRVHPLLIRATDAVLPFPHTHATAAVRYQLDVPLIPGRDVALHTVERVVDVTAYHLEGTTPVRGLQSIRRFLHDFLVGEFGALTMALTYALAIVLPIVTTFFIVFSVLEDTGYFPRMAIMVNRIFRVMGLNGKAVLPMLLGLGCDTMATMATRVLETRKERVVTTMLLALAVPCSAQLGVLLAMMAILAPVAALFWLGLVVGVIVLVGWLTARLFDGDTSDFILEIPPMRRPQLSNVIVKTMGRLNWYLREVIPIFVVGTAILFVLDRLNVLQRIAQLGAPVVTGWLGLPVEMANAFLIGFLRRDFGAVYILDAATGPVPTLSAHQILVAMVTITLFMPCIANFLMIAKEHGQKTAWRMAAFIFPFAFFVGGLVNQVGTWLGI